MQPHYTIEYIRLPSAELNVEKLVSNHHPAKSITITRIYWLPCEKCSSAIQHDNRTSLCSNNKCWTRCGEEDLIKHLMFGFFVHHFLLLREYLFFTLYQRASAHRLNNICSIVFLFSFSCCNRKCHTFTIWITPFVWLTNHKCIALNFISPSQEILSLSLGCMKNRICHLTLFWIGGIGFVVVNISFDVWLSHTWYRPNVTTKSTDA